MSSNKKMGYAALAITSTGLVIMTYMYFSTKGKVVEYMKANTAAVSIPNSVLPKSWTAKTTV